LKTESRDSATWEQGKPVRASPASGAKNVIALLTRTATVVVIMKLRIWFMDHLIRMT
jgi:hypothetical protein